MPKDRLNTPGALPERSVGFSDGDGRSLPEGEIGSVPPQKLRTSADTFQFDALINGVSTLNRDTQDSQASPYSNSSPSGVAEPARFSSQAQQAPPNTANLNRVVLILALTSVCVALLAVVTVLFSTHRPSNTPTTGQALPAAPGDTTLADIANAFTRRGLPDPHLSPGAFSPGPLHLTTTASVAVPDAVQREVLTAYGINPDDKRFQICYVVPPSLNGTSDAKNLFPVTPWFRGLKRRLDAHLTKLVIAKKFGLAQAQKELMSDWIQTVHRHPVRNYGYNDTIKAKRVEKNTVWGK